MLLSPSWSILVLQEKGWDHTAWQLTTNMHSRDEYMSPWHPYILDMVTLPKIRRYGGHLKGPMDGWVLNNALVSPVVICVALSPAGDHQQKQMQTNPQLELPRIDRLLVSRPVELDRSRFCRKEMTELRRRKKQYCVSASAPGPVQNSADQPG